jgi:hypothetical protein
MSYLSKTRSKGETLDSQLAMCQASLARLQRAQALAEKEMRTLDHEWHERQRLIERLKGLYSKLQSELENVTNE